MDFLLPLSLSCWLLFLLPSATPARFPLSPFPSPGVHFMAFPPHTGPTTLEGLLCGVGSLGKGLQCSGRGFPQSRLRDGSLCRGTRSLPESSSSRESPSHGGCEGPAAPVCLAWHRLWAYLQAPGPLHLPQAYQGPLTWRRNLSR